MIYDVIVSGVGPAGAAFLKQLEGSGLKVLALEKEKFPRKKLCAGGLTPKAYALINNLFGGVDRVVRCKVFSFHLFNGSDEVVVSSSQPLTYLTDREELDSFLFEKVGGIFEIHTGEPVVDVELEEDRVKVITDRGSYWCRCLIAADGANSRIARKLKVKRKFGFTYEGDFDCKWDKEIVIDFTGFEWGYYWIFPKGDFVTAGLGEFKNYRDLRKRFAFFNRKHGIKGNSFYEGGFPIPVGQKRNDVLRNRVIFLGDAGGLVDPLTGEGIYYAVKSGVYAAEVVKKVFEDGKFENLVVYKQLIDKDMGSEFWWAKVVGGIFFHFKGLNFYLVRKSREIGELTARLLSGKIGYKEAVKTFFRLAPKVLLR